MSIIVVYSLYSQSVCLSILSQAGKYGNLLPVNPVYSEARMWGMNAAEHVTPAQVAGIQRRARALWLSVVCLCCQRQPHLDDSAWRSRDVPAKLHDLRHQLFQFITHLA